MNLSTITKLARANRLEVEHILRAAKLQLPGLAEELERLSTECGWSDGGRDGANLIIPFRRWAVTAATYVRNGSEGLLELATSQSYLPFVLALLDELHSREALLVLIGLVEKAEPQDAVASTRIAASINSLLSFPPQIQVGPEEEQRLRAFIHGLLARELTEPQRATALCALRGIGDQTSLMHVQARPPLGEPWRGLEKSVTRRIKKRLRPVATPN